MKMSEHSLIRAMHFSTLRLGESKILSQPLKYDVEILIFDHQRVEESKYYE